MARNKAIVFDLWPTESGEGITVGGVFSNTSQAKRPMMSDNLAKPASETAIQQVMSSKKSK